MRNPLRIVAAYHAACNRSLSLRALCDSFNNATVTIDHNPPSMPSSRLRLHPALLLSLLLPVAFYVLPLASSGLAPVGQSDHPPIARGPQILGLWNYTAAKVAVISLANAAFRVCPPPTLECAGRLLAHRLRNQIMPLLQAPGRSSGVQITRFRCSLLLARVAVDPPPDVRPTCKRHSTSALQPSVPTAPLPQ